MFGFKFTANRPDPWTFYLCIGHIFGVVSSFILAACVVAEYFAEHNSVGEFKLNITWHMRIMYCCSAGLILVCVCLGILAHKKPEKSSYWVAYCVLTSVVSVFLLFGSISATSQAGAQALGLSGLKKTMEYYQDGNVNATKWDHLHKKYKCCGIDNYKDWQDVRYGRTSLQVPRSCCRPKRLNNKLCGLNILPHDDKADKKIYAEGCHDHALSTLRTCMKVTGGFGIIISLVHIFIAMVACYLVVNKKV